MLQNCNDHINTYYNFTKVGSYYAFSFDECSFHLTIYHETFPIRTQVSLRRTSIWRMAAIILLMDKWKIHPFSTFTHLVFINVSLIPHLDEAPLLVSPITACPLLSAPWGKLCSWTCICVTSLSLMWGHAVSTRAKAVPVLFTNNYLRWSTIWHAVGTQ